MASMTSSGGPISEVRDGMRVVDSAGQDVGSVEEVRMSDPGSTTPAGQGTGDSGGLLSGIARAFGGGSGLTEQAQERLARLGYVRVDASGLFSGDRYVAADEIVDVSGDVVHLSVPADRLLG